jgi:hypothetical protein
MPRDSAASAGTCGMTMKTRTERSGNWTLGPFAYVPVRHAKSGLTAAR